MKEIDLFGMEPPEPQTPVAASEWSFSQPHTPNPDTVSPAAPEAVSEPPEAVSVMADLIGKTVGIPEPKWLLTDRQKRYVEIYTRTLHVANRSVTGEAIWKLWPEGYANGRVSSSIKDPINRAKAARAGQRPMIEDIQGYLGTTEYAEKMKELGIEVNTENTGLTTEQMGLLTHLSNVSDGKNLRQKLKDTGISWSKYQAWRSQPVFSKYHNEMLGNAIKEALPYAKQQIAAKMVAGDSASIKLGMELSGEYDPRGQKQVDAAALVTVILEVLEEKIKDQGMLLEIAALIQLRSQALGGIRKELS